MIYQKSLREMALFGFVAKALTRTVLFLMKIGLWIMPLWMSILFWNRQYVRDYYETIRKLRTHIQALSEGPVEHYFRDIFLRPEPAVATIEGACVQCGRCCLNKRCVFLQNASEDKFICGIYSSPFRKWSNCGSFPINAHDIARYDCPSYFVVPATKTIYLART